MSATASKGSLSAEDSLKYLMYQILQISFVNGGRDASYDLPSYYWYAQVPSLNPLDDQYEKAEDLLASIKTYPINEETGNPIDRYSFLDRTGKISEEIQGGIVASSFQTLEGQNPFGLEVTYALDQYGMSHLIVLYADKNSPAGQKGIERGWEITAINGISDITYDGSEGTNVTAVNKAIYGRDPITITLKSTEGDTEKYTLNPETYTINPILFDTIYTINNKKIGYFVFYTFTSTENDSGKTTPTKQILENEFDKLESASITDLIVDLRYNGGGSVLTAEYMDNAIAPVSAQGKIMYQYLYNNKLSQNKELLGLTSNVKFSPSSGWNLDHVFFIVDHSTASASELTLNNLNPYMDVVVVGDTTYGKPVGFINFTISEYDSEGNKNYLADLYAINFATKNANGKGNYYEGIAPDILATDYINIPWGNSIDENLEKIFDYLSIDDLTRKGIKNIKEKNQNYLTPIEKIHSKHSFNGMVNYRIGKQFNIKNQ